MNTDVFSPVSLPCSGRTMPNRLVKVALYEHLAKMNGGPPSKYHMGLYAEWAKHGWGMIVTGNVQVARDHLSLGRDILVPEVLDEETLAPYKKLARTIHGQDSHKQSARPLAVVQLNHTGRQSPNIIGGRRPGVPPTAPSPLQLGSNNRVQSHDGAASVDTQSKPHPVLGVLFQQPREMTLDDIKQVQQSFIRGALTALESGFDGVQLHCAHGYLLSQFLNPKSNVRQDEYSVKNALRMVYEIVEGIRAVVPKDFVVGIKINSADYVEAGERPSDERVLGEIQRVLDHIRTIALWRMVDFIEISGGDYESPEFMGPKAASPRQAFFARFAKEARECLRTAGPSIPLILLTGGLRSPAHLQTALDAGHADLLGIGRGSLLRPDLPVALRERLSRAAANGTSIALDDEPFADEPDVRLPFWMPKVPLVGAGAGMAWYNVHMRSIATSQLGKRRNGKAYPAPPPPFGMGGLEASLWQLVWLEWRELLIGGLAVCGMAALVYYPVPIHLP